MYIWCQCDDENGVSCRFIKLNKNQKKIALKTNNKFQTCNYRCTLKIVKYLE
jgi:hypothetical protein